MVKKKQEIPVYVINGFLEAGKTSFISDTVTADYFAFDKTTVLLSCEQGELEYDVEDFRKHKTVVEYVTREELLDLNYLAALEDSLNIGRVIIELNGMWASDLPLTFPDNWLMNQQITIVDGSSFSMYFMNNDLKSLFVNMVRESELIIFNRSTDDEKLKDYLRSIKAVNPSAEVLFEDEKGYPINVRLDEDLPYDINAKHIILDDTAYGIWFIDMMDRAERYLGKEVTFKASVMKPSIIGKNEFVPGRKVMTCCADDIQFLGYLCKYNKSDTLKDGDWIELTAEIKIEYFKGYSGDGPVLYATKIEKSSPPEEELIYFGNS